MARQTRTSSSRHHSVIILSLFRPLFHSPLCNTVRCSLCTRAQDAMAWASAAPARSCQMTHDGLGINERFFGRFYDKLDPPECLYSAQEILEARQFVTSTTWSLEKIFCMRNRTQMVNVVKGPSVVLPGQMRSSFACSIVGILLVFLFFVALVVWSAT